MTNRDFYDACWALVDKWKKDANTCYSDPASNVYDSCARELNELLEEDIADDDTQ